jgi:hypothetical protein
MDRSRGGRVGGVVGGVALIIGYSEDSVESDNL